ncbi:hypothetical protein [Azospirillum sp. TSO22-1]|nr:hypothetical protein [Azospirillum sp. TSO22-1]
MKDEQDPGTIDLFGGVVAVGRLLGYARVSTDSTAGRRGTKWCACLSQC